MGYPYLIEYVVQDVQENLCDYIINNRDFIFKKVHNTGAVLLRGFNLKTAEDFRKVVTILQPELQNYIGGDSPRSKVTNNIYTSTNYPPEEIISMHHEKSFSNSYPKLIYFFCEIEPNIGGETPIADGREIYKKMPSDIIEKFEKRKLKYIMNMHSGDGFGKSWKDVFEISSKIELEKLLNELKIKFKWKENGLLRVEEIVNPIIIHPENGDKIFFSQADQWHPSNLDENVLADMKGIMPEEDFYHNCRYGDDSEISFEDLNRIKEIVNKERVFFKWKRGDLLILDNLISMHGRNSFSGPRRILVAMS